MPYDVNKDVRKGADEQEFTPVPAGIYRCQIENAEEKLNKNEEDMLVLKCRVLDGKQTGRYLWINVVYSWSWAPALMKGICVSTGIDWDKVKTVTPEMLKDEVIYIQAPGTEDGFAKVKNPPDGETVPEKVEEENEDDIPF